MVRVKTEEKRQAILKVAGEVFESEGFEAASMAQIAARVGGSKGTLYSYFSSKEELFVEVMLQTAQSHKKHMDCYIYQPELSLEEMLIRFGTGYVGFVTKPWYLDMYRTVIGFKNNSEVRKQFYEKGQKKGIAKIAKILDEAMFDGRLKPVVDTTVMAKQLKALLDAEVLTPLLVGSIDVPSDAELKEIVARACKGFLAMYGTEKA